ncbi:MAG: hypothetical protein IJQ02_02220, partial [Oscillospiraceae bacterium]|nr:hypothetical protein [Oscillospiraceae bacterium]
MAFSMYRCAACGSPNVVTDTQTAGLKYDYLKGAIGTAVLGVGGAAAGITSGNQLVYKCKDCGICLTYPMSEKMKSMIDLGVMSEESRKQLPFPWEIIRQ